MDSEREKVVEAIFEGIIAAYNATEPEDNDLFTDLQIMAEAALASLESAGFKVVSNA